MFISKKHIPRRTVLQGVGATIALPLLEAMIPAATAWADTRRREDPEALCLCRLPARRDHGSLVAQGNRHGLHHVADPAAPGAVPQASDHRLRPAQQARGNARAPRLHRAGLVDLREALGFRQGRSGLRRERRPDRRPLRWAGHASPVARTHRRLRAAPASHGARRPSRCRRKATRARSSRSSSDRATPIRNAPRSWRKPAASSIACKGQAQRLQASLGVKDRSVVSDYLDSVREIERRVQMAEKAAQQRPGDSGCADRHAERYHGVFQADVRPDGAGVPGRHHARDHALHGSRSQHAHLHEPEHCRGFPSAVASRQQPGEDGQAGADSEVPRAKCLPDSSRRSRPRKKATAPCSIIPRFCLAAT